MIFFIFEVSWSQNKIPLDINHLGVFLTPTSLKDFESFFFASRSTKLLKYLEVWTSIPSNFNEPFLSQLSIFLTTKQTVKFQFMVIV